MNQEHNNEVKSGQTDISPLAKLEAAISEYLASQGDDREGAGGVLTGWLLVAEEQNPIGGTSCITKAVRDLQSFTTTLGLATYLKEVYTARATGQ